MLLSNQSLRERDRKTMRTALAKTGKPGTIGAAKPKPHCGTLTYIAECRGVLLKAGAVPRQTTPGDVMTRTVRKYSND